MMIAEVVAVALVEAWCLEPPLPERPALAGHQLELESQAELGAEHGEQLP